MYQTGDLLIYGNTGVCRVESVGPPQQIRGADRDRLYYTLMPLYRTEVIHVPIDTAVFMRPVLSREAAEELIERIPEISEEGTSHLDQKMLAEHYRSLLENHRCESLVQLIKTLYAKSISTLQNGKKPAQADQRFMKRAEELLYGEFAAALGIAPDEVVQYIADRAAHTACS